MKAIILSVIIILLSLLFAYPLHYLMITKNQLFVLYLAVLPFILCGIGFLIDDFSNYLDKQIKKHNNKKVFITSVTAIAAVNPEGFTINSNNMEPETAGYCVALAETQNSFNREGLARVYDVISSGRANAVGGWLDRESGLYYYDAVVVLQDREKAIELGRLNNQLAIFDLNNMEEIRL